MQIRELIDLVEFRKRGTVKCGSFDSPEADMLLTYIKYSNLLRHGDPAGGGIYEGTELNFNDTPDVGLLLDKIEDLLNTNVVENLINSEKSRCRTAELLKFQEEHPELYKIANKK